MHPRLFILILLLLVSSSSYAFHIVGGELTYEHQGGDVYEIRLTVYRDCFSAGAEFDDPASIGVFYGNGAFFESYDFNDPFITPVETTVDFACTDITASACVEKGVYVRTITLPPSSTGYYVAYQRCCRNSSIQNLILPDEYGATYAAFIPAEDVASSNSCPVFNDLPPVGLCINLPFSFDHGAEDMDGDSLVYEFCVPYNGGSQNDPAPDIPSPPPWSSVVWSAGYNVNYQIAADPIFTLDPNTGLLTGTPNQIGQYVMGICVREYRDGVFLSEVRRDFQFNVVACPSAVLASFADLNQGIYCEGLEIEFDNLSANASTFIWDFGDGQISTLENPTHLFSGVGEYSVMLISEPGGFCADTSIAIYSVAPNPDPEVLDPILNCPDNTYDIEVGGELDDVVSYEWNIDSPDGPLFIDGPLLPDIAFTSTGLTYIQVEVFNSFGCSGNDEKTFMVPESPSALISPILDPCQGLTIAFQSEVEFADELYWDFGDAVPGDNAIVANPVYTFSESGEYLVTLTASSPVACADETELLVQVNPALEIDVLTPDPQCLEENSFDFFLEGNYTDNATFSWDFGESGIPTSTEEMPSSIHFSNQGSYQIQAHVTEGPCAAFDAEYVNVVEELNVDFTTESSGCAPFEAFFFDQTTGGASNNYTWSFGDESQSDLPGSVVHPYNTPGTYDVTLTVESTFGCLGTETLTIPDAVIVSPSPEADFVMDPPYADINEPFLRIISTANGADSCVYIIEGQAPMFDCDVNIVFPGGGNYEITQVVMNEYGCEDRLTTDFTVNGHAFYAPSAISLNQDGLNDFFMPVTNGDIVDYRMVIFDRWGSILFETDQIGEPWVPDYAHVGMHAYKVWVRDEHNIRQLYSGTFTLIR